MNNTFGKNVTVTLFGESHGKAIGAVLDGIAPGIPVDETDIAHALSLRRGEAALSTPRREADAFELVSGVYRGKTTGTPLTVLIRNADTRSGDYDKTARLFRPGHADLTAMYKYHGFADPHGGGHFSGRITAALVAVGAIAQAALKARGIFVFTHLSRCAGISDRVFHDLTADRALCDRPFPVLDETAANAMREEILRAAADGDSVGGVLQTAVTGLPVGVGEPWFDSVESVLAHALFAVPAVKGVSFGDGFGLCDLRGSRANDPLREENGKIVTATNRNGGINGGITNGMPVLFDCAVKPTPSIAKKQETVNGDTLENAEIEICGRHDPCIAPRAAAVVNAVTALVLCDLLTGRFGTDWLASRPD
ncbi:MAG TPA: chorismate synthase [Ruminococcaceae bacterium]|nr:chorismate synthase [Oscillospiraceae bacterium]